MQARPGVADGRPRLDRCVLRQTGEAEGAACRLSNHVERGKVAEGTVGREAFHLSVDHSRTDAPDFIVTKAQTLYDARSEILEEHIGLLEQTFDETAPL